MERGAKIETHGDLMVRRGIIGAKINVKGNLWARFVVDSHVKVDGNIVVQNYSQKSNIEVRGAARIHGKEGGDRQLCLLGGRLMSAGDIDLMSIGSSTGQETLAAAGVDIEIRGKIDKYGKGCELCKNRIQRAMRTLETTTGNLANVEAILHAINTAPPGKRQFLRSMLEAIRESRDLHKKLERELTSLRANRADGEKQAAIRVAQIAFQGTTVQVGEATRRLATNQRSVEFRLDLNRGQIAVKPIH